jgi:TrmH family RNA methyltransferase
LLERKERERRQSFLVEGILPVWRAVDANVRIDALIVAPELLSSEGARSMVARQARLGTRVVAVAGSVFSQIAERDHPSGLAAVIPELDTGLDCLPSSCEMFAGLYAPGNPGNLGTSLRTLDATGGGGAIVIGGTDVYSPACVKASMGTIFTVPFARVDAWDAVRDWCRAQGFVTVATSSRAEPELWRTEIPARSLLLFGNEGDGLPPNVVEECDRSLRIPMAHGGSLNLAVAVAVVLFEYRRQHQPR